jgi:hypothetical protein
MPIAITLYRTGGGRQYPTLAQAEQMEREEQHVAALIREYLGSRRPTGNGDDYIQHSRGTKQAVARLLEGRSLRGDDDSNSPWRVLGFHWQCLDGQDREWGQPYYANHTPAGAVARRPEA